MYIFKMKIGCNVIEIHEENMSGICKNVSLLSYIPKKCDACDSENLYPHYNKTKEGTEYYKIRCSDCSAELLFHQYKAGGMYIDQNEKMTVYKPEAKQGSPGTPKEDIPF